MKKIIITLIIIMTSPVAFTGDWPDWKRDNLNMLTQSYAKYTVHYSIMAGRMTVEQVFDI
jgi:hypothetical protein